MEKHPFSGILILRNGNGSHVLPRFANLSTSTALHLPLNVSTIMATTVTSLMAVVFFLVPIAYKLGRKQRIELSDLAKCALSAMSLPNLCLCLFYLVTNPGEAIKMPEVFQYLVIAVLIIIYLSVLEIQKVFDP